MTLMPSARAFIAISTGSALRPESEMITSTSPACQRAGVQDRPGQPVDPLQRAAERRRPYVDAHDTGDGQQVHDRQAARAVDRVLGGERGMPGAEGEDPAARGDGVGDQLPGRGDPVALLVADLPQQVDRGVEELPGQPVAPVALSHCRGPLSSSLVEASHRHPCLAHTTAHHCASRVPRSRLFTREASRGADHVAVWTSALSIRARGPVRGRGGTVVGGMRQN